MDFSLMMACAVIKSINHEARSALPNAPVIAPRPAGRTRRRLVRLQALLARLLHRAAWAIEPHFAKYQGSPMLNQGDSSHTRRV
ncbi:hypothetical protein [Arthrobacter sp. MMS18-M83]|uniref:hypothetical protein n=1 Tax=Arthrobacter sp. MMS18-M83 TaxID=2996261 RepID=UPI00227A7A69|nr:hypothetical protein [Arthrobacter sp. MMS18-M83]WAH97494.1 hypothetical protein OW521_00900 [Arthrobacter sp. MMS18-M83]